MERITRADVDLRVANVNRRMEARGSIVRYAAEGRNGYIGLDRWHAPESGVIATVMVGTKREVAEFLHAMMVALDDSVFTG